MSMHEYAAQTKTPSITLAGPIKTANQGNHDDQCVRLTTNSETARREGRREGEDVRRGEERREGGGRGEKTRGEELSGWYHNAKLWISGLCGSSDQVKGEDL